MSLVDLICELDPFIHEIKDKEISDYDLEKYLKEILGKYGCIHFRTVYRSVYYVVFIFECEKYTVEVRVEYCECNKITSTEFEITTKPATMKVYRRGDKCG
jgi:hypothetical protein